MKNRIFLAMLLFLIGLNSKSQEKTISNHTMIRKEFSSNSPTNRSKSILLEASDWNKKFSPGIFDLKYDLVQYSIDSAKVYSIVRSEISAQNFSQLNKSRWYINTKMNCFGEIVSVAFSFFNESEINPDEFSKISDRIRKEIKWSLTFDRQVKDTFYLQLSFPGPKL